MPSFARSDPLTVCYVLEDTPLFGGVKVVLQQASWMSRRGHRVVVASPGDPPSWFDLEAAFVRLPRLESSSLPPADVTVATYWTTLEPVAGVTRGEAVQYCQGFEGSYTHNDDDHPMIEEAYRCGLPAFVVSSHLGRMLSTRFGRPSRLVPQPLEDFFRPEPKGGPSDRPRVLVPSPFEIDWKGVETGILAVSILRRRGVDARLVRLSQWPATTSEKSLLAPDEFHHHLAPRAVAELLLTCDLVLTPSWEQEGFGLPALEAMASGIPVVASDVPCYRDWASPAARLSPPREPEAFADAAEEILASPGLWRTHRERGIEVAKGFREEVSAPSAEDALYWVATGAWRDSMTT